MAPDEPGADEKVCSGAASDHAPDAHDGEQADERDQHQQDHDTDQQLDEGFAHPRDGDDKDCEDPQDEQAPLTA